GRSWRRQSHLGRSPQYLLLDRSDEARRCRFHDAGSALCRSACALALPPVRARHLRCPECGLTMSLFRVLPRPRLRRHTRARKGIPDKPLKPDIERAREMYAYAAPCCCTWQMSFFGLEDFRNWARDAPAPRHSDFDVLNELKALLSGASTAAHKLELRRFCWL